MERSEYFRIINKTQTYDEMVRLMKIWASKPEVDGEILDYAARHAFSIRGRGNRINRWTGD